jgi:hypothetical protein
VVRSAAIINRIPSEIDVILRTEAPREILQEEIDRPISIEPATFDCGAVHTDSFTVDPVATLAKYSQIHLRNSSRLREEAEYLRHKRARLVVSDIASFPFAVAHHATIPSVAIGNFTWRGIYAPFVADRPSYRSMLEEMRLEYELATWMLRLPLAMPMDEWSEPIDVPLVCRPGTSMRPALAGFGDLDPDASWCLIYLGQYPVEFDWDRLARVEGWHFLVLSKTPSPASGVTAIDPRRFAAADVVASCQAVLAKPGYATVANSIAADVPMVYTMPTGFAEADSLDEHLQAWGRGVRIDRELFFTGDIAPALAQARTTVAAQSYELGGAQVVADVLAQAHRDSPVS